MNTGSEPAAQSDSGTQPVDAPFSGVSAFDNLLKGEAQSSEDESAKDETEQPNEEQGQQSDDEQNSDEQDTDDDGLNDDEPNDDDDDGLNDDDSESVTITDDLKIDVDGSEVSLGDLKANYIPEDVLNGKIEQAQEITQKEMLEKFKDHLAVAATDTVQQINAYRKIDWEKLAVDDPKKYAIHRQRFDALREKAQKQYDGLKAVDEVDEEKAAQERKQAIESAVTTIKSTYPSFNDKSYESVIQRAVTLGATEDEARTITDPRILTALFESALYRKSKTETKKKSKGVKHSIKKRSNQQVTTNSKKTTKPDGSFDGTAAFANLLKK
ncbi:hypothetical protein VCHA35O137_30180 [Vibrio chagasii]|nr:hypothetical protein VCHA35P150_20435 [Vibrio chagasii]CAH6905804.1 hypothetical protein VCHA56P515_100044 [Vibrio chagasii]CAH6925675.1 hypothetical protein VCHA35O137_30180 [Vibrio chagasii]CAH6969314.1 hypothetical protein VCHA53O463_110118 [Vibrio chagasii]CAH7075380.1 hypothetical protein VCHA52P454_10711 [Vibrio chagasii]